MDKNLTLARMMKVHAYNHVKLFMINRSVGHSCFAEKISSRVSSTNSFRAEPQFMFIILKKKPLHIYKLESQA